MLRAPLAFMNGRIDYRVPLPRGRNLRWESLPDGGVRVERDVVSRAGLWREAIVSLVSVLFLAGLEAGLLVWLLRGGRAPVVVLVVRSALLIGLPFLLFYAVRDAIQNGGIVTLVTVSGQTLYWRKENLWGPREFFWPVDSVESIRVRRAGWESSLVVRRRRGHPLNAFGYHDPTELEQVAAALTQALAQAQSLATARGTSSLPRP